MTNRDIVETLAEAGVELDRRTLSMGDAIKSTGAFDIQVKLGMDVEATLKVYVVEA